MLPADHATPLQVIVRGLDAEDGLGVSDDSIGLQRELEQLRLHESILDDSIR